MRRRQPKGRLAWSLELVIVIALLAAFVVWLSSDRGGFQRAQEAPDCGEVVTGTCVETRAGEFHARGNGLSGVSARYRPQAFTDSDGDRQGFEMRLSRREARRLDGTGVRGLYYDGNLVGIETEDGQRRWGYPGWWGFPPTLSTLAIALLLAFAGGCGLVLRRLRRRR